MQGLLKRSVRNILRIPARSILLGLLIFVVSFLTMMGFTIESGTKTSIMNIRRSLGNDVRLSVNFRELMRRYQQGEDVEIPTLTEEIAKKLLSSKYVINYNFVISQNATSDTIKPVEINISTDNMRQKAGRIFGFGRQDQQQTFRLVADLKPELSNDFRNGNKQIIQERFINQQDLSNKAYVVVVDKLLADKNNLKVGSQFDLKLSDSSKSFNVMVIGICDEKTSTDEQNSFSAMSSNTIYIPYTTLKEIVKSIDPNSADVITYAMYYLDNPLNADNFKKDAQKLGIDTTKYMLNANDNLFNRIAAPIERVSSFSRVTIIGILIAGAIIIMLLMSIVIRERKLEIGILRSLGLKKGKLAAQFAMEALIITLVATILGGVIGGALSQSVANALLNKEINAQQQAFEQRGFMMMVQRDANLSNRIQERYSELTKLEVKIGVNEVLKLCGVSLLLVLCVSIISIYSISRFEPMSLLVSRS